MLIGELKYSLVLVIVIENPVSTKNDCDDK